MACHAQGRLDEAITQLRHVLRLEPRQAEAHYHLGTMLGLQGQLTEAADCFRRAAELRPHWAEAFNNLGVTRERQGDLVEAVACYRRRGGKARAARRACLFRRLARKIRVLRRSGRLFSSRWPSSPITPKQISAWAWYTNDGAAWRRPRLAIAGP